MKIAVYACLVFLFLSSVSTFANSDQVSCLGKWTIDKIPVRLFERPDGSVYLKSQMPDNSVGATRQTEKLLVKIIEKAAGFKTHQFDLFTVFLPEESAGQFWSRLELRPDFLIVTSPKFGRLKIGKTAIIKACNQLEKETRA